jgi:hypothetical protein
VGVAHVEHAAAVGEVDLEARAFEHEPRHRSEPGAGARRVGAEAALARGLGVDAL